MHRSRWAPAATRQGVRATARLDPTSIGSRRLRSSVFFVCGLDILRWPASSRVWQRAPPSSSTHRPDSARLRPLRTLVGVADALRTASSRGGLAPRTTRHRRSRH